MVQPYLSAVDSVGRRPWSSATASTATYRKAQILTAGAGIEGPVRNDRTRGQVSASTATEAELDVANRALAAVPGGENLLYARVDLIPGPDGSPLIIELELTEPNLYLHHAPGSAESFAKAIAARL